MMKSNLVKNKAQRALPGVEPLRLSEVLEVLVIGDDSERVVCSLQPVPPLL